MKSLFGLAVCFWIGLAAVQAQGIQFRSGAIGSVLTAARSAKKPIFVEIYSPTCHICQGFLPVFAEKRVGAFYNKNFVSTKLDIDSKETQAFLQRNRLYVPSLPLFLFLSPSGELVHVAMSNNTADDVIHHGGNALNASTRSVNMANRYANGDRSANFLIDYGMYAKITRDTVTNIRVMNDYARQQPASSYTGKTNWLALQKLVMDVDNPLFQYLIGHLDPYVKAYGAETVKTVAENILMSSLYSSRGSQYPAAKILTIRNQLQQIGINARVASNRTLLPEVNAYFRAGQAGRAAARMDEHIAQNQFTTPEYLYVMRLFNGRSPDASDAPTVVRWANKALAQAQAPNEQADLYYEMAEAYRRGGKTADGLKAAQKSLELARSAKLPTQRNTDQLARMK